MPEAELLRELHANLWGSLRHVFNTDRVLLAVLYATNFAGFVVLATESLHQPVTTAVTVVAVVGPPTFSHEAARNSAVRCT